MNENPFLDALKKSVGQARTSFESADKELQSAVVEAGKAVREFSGGKASIGLDPTRDTVAGRTYDLDLTAEGRRPQTVATFFIPQSGYPIEYGSGRAEDFAARGSLMNGADVHQYLLHILSEPDSPLTVAIAFLLRSERQ